jgi:hypothetical protein
MPLEKNGRFAGAGTSRAPGRASRQRAGRSHAARPMRRAVRSRWRWSRGPTPRSGSASRTARRSTGETTVESPTETSFSAPLEASSPTVLYLKNVGRLTADGPRAFECLAGFPYGLCAGCRGSRRSHAPGQAARMCHLQGFRGEERSDGGRSRTLHTAKLRFGPRLRHRQARVRLRSVAGTRWKRRSSPSGGAGEASRRLRSAPIPTS